MLIILLQFVLSDTQVLTLLYDVNFLDMIWETKMNIRQNQQQQKMKKSTYTHTLNEYYNNKTVQNYPGKLVSSNIQGIMFVETFLFTKEILSGY